MRLRLSPLVTETKQSAFSMPARRSTASSMQLPTIMSPPKSRPSRLNADTNWSTTVTW